jgi:hypothetical protein
MTRTRPRMCRVCNTPLALGECPHIDVRNGQVRMSTDAWDRLARSIAEASEELEMFRNPQKEEPCPDKT